MKLLRIATAYQSYWEDFYARRPGLAEQSYGHQKNTLDFDGFGWADFWANALNPLGYDVMEVTANIAPLQRAWALENNIDCSGKDWLLKIAFEQAKRFQPVVLFIDNHSVFPPVWLEELRVFCPSIRLLISWCGAPYQDPAIFRAYDLVLSCIPEFVEQFRQMGHWSEHINHAFEPRILERISSVPEPAIDFSFIGQIVRGSQYHLQREKILERLVTEIPISIYSPNASISWKRRLKITTKQVAHRIVEGLHKAGVSKSWLIKIPKVEYLIDLPRSLLSPVNPQLQPFMKPAVFGLDMYRTLQNSKVTFNSHIDVSPNSASNMRMFEATGVGTCLITDWKRNINTLFEPDREVVTYKSAEECIEKVKWLLEHPAQRLAIAQAGQARTLKFHTFKQRAEQLNSLIVNALK
ncbi:glycosyltransferase [Leptothermofonsia sichuanensis E412]|uniref:CgeB family protein n=1 Tax=Leptothermofonsia sichuanensis TaxID=2917832 RepID=UPI001CA6CEBC|nr:glycosyltransferase [Leptothermofonsia sichuanensis]QZZ20245.1 glycosyltransferase [Leptothermofonsia sichuanensis E412]